MYTLILLLAIVHLSFQLSTTEQPCDVSAINTTLYIDRMSVGSYSTARFHRGEFLVGNNWMFLNLTPFKTVVDKLNATVDPSDNLVVKCDDQSIASYSDIVFTINGVDVIAKPDQYINQELQYNDQCLVLIWFLEKTADVDYLLPDYLKDQVCRAEKQ
ncbi:hypothetical protein M3Y95_01047200 [Aphelenchoides besseyi]|nr:hypothetical protein M3Y95_01047200 [Aphelenchoides besseyi]